MANNIADDPSQWMNKKEEGERSRAAYLGYDSDMDEYDYSILRRTLEEVVDGDHGDVSHGLTRYIRSILRQTPKRDVFRNRSNPDELDC